MSENMKNGLVVKDNALINASYNLEVTEQRLMLLAIINARETGNGITADSKLQIHASDYMKHFNVDKKTAYEALKNAVDNLFNRQFSFREVREVQILLLNHVGLVGLHTLQTKQY
jgi:plasmid replication initiation protein